MNATLKVEREGKSVSIKCRLQTRYKMQTEYKTLCLTPPKKLESKHYLHYHCWQLLLGGSSCWASKFRERMAASVSPGDDASPEDSGEDNNIAVSTL